VFHPEYFILKGAEKDEEDAKARILKFIGVRRA